MNISLSIYKLLQRGTMSITIPEGGSFEDRKKVYAKAAEYKGEDFYAELLSQMKVEYTDKVPTAGISVKGASIVLMINPDFWKTLKNDEDIGILKHECLHIMMGHLSREKDFKTNQMIKNVAMDLAINEFIPEIAHMANVCSVANLKKQYPNIENKQSYEWYYDFLMNNSNPQLPNTTDSHDEWEKMSDEERGVAKQVIKGAVQQATERASNIPANIQELIRNVLKPKNNWRTILRNFVANAKDHTFEFTRNRRNRRYGTLLPGYKYDLKLNLMVVVDTSGSTCDMAEEFFTEIDGIANLGYDITLVQCDTHIQSIEPYKKGEWRKIQIKGRGGTLFQPALDLAKEKQPDALIYFTDGETWETTLTNPKIPVLWAIVGGYSGKFSFGKYINVGK